MGSSATRGWLREHWPVLVVLALTGAATLGCLSADFLSDDFGIIKSGRVIHDPSLWTEMLKHPAMYVNAFGGELAEDHTYRPVPSSLFFLEAAIGGHSPFFYHFTNWLLHLVNVCLVYVFALRLLSPERQRYAWIAAAFFGSAPQLAEAYVWINGCSDPLAALFALAALLAWQPALSAELSPGRRLGRFALTGLLFFLALLSKEIWLVAWPVVWITPWLTRLGLKRRLLVSVPFAMAVLGTLLVRSLVLQGATRGSSASRALSSLALVPVLLLDGVSELVGPTHLYWRHLFAEYNGLPGWAFWLAAAACLGLGAGALALFRRAPLVLWACTWFALSLAPAAVIASAPGWCGFGRYLYVPAIALAVLLAEGVGWFAEQLQTNGRPAGLAPALMSLLVLRNGVLLAQETGDYADEAALYTDVIEQAPEMAHGYRGLADIMLERKRPGPASELYRKALQRDPTSIEAALGLMRALELSGDHVGAERLARKALRIAPRQRANAIRAHLIANLHLHAPEETIQLLLDCLASPYERTECDPWIVRLTHDHPLREQYRSALTARAKELPEEARKQLQALVEGPGSPH
jgi:tetratricopeptide (TPR) repeat protein